ncbi:MAG: IclR family transcriptional regulator [Holophaga sp.]|nr:IclR family transcriptional regulator [Holophaga sp.]
MTSQPPNLPQDDEPATSGVAVLDRAFAILGAFRAADDALSLAELSRRTGLYKSTILRLLIALESGGFIRRLQDGRYSVGPEPLRLAQIFQSSFHVQHVIPPILADLCTQTGETANFYVRDGGKRVVLHRVEPERSIRFTIREGERLPLEFGSSGKVLLAFGQPERKGLEDVRARLWCISFGERDPETASLAVPVFGPGQGLLGALALSGPIERFRAGDIRRSCQAMLEAGARASTALGGDGSVFFASLERLDSDIRSALKTSREDKP